VHYAPAVVAELDKRARLLDVHLTIGKSSPVSHVETFEMILVLPMRNRLKISSRSNMGRGLDTHEAAAAHSYRWPDSA
jgi:hypothetical protein